MSTTFQTATRGAVVALAFVGSSGTTTYFEPTSTSREVRHVGSGEASAKLSMTSSTSRAQLLPNVDGRNLLLEQIRQFAFLNPTRNKEAERLYSLVALYADENNGAPYSIQSLASFIRFIESDALIAGPRVIALTDNGELYVSWYVDARPASLLFEATGRARHSGRGRAPAATLESAREWLTAQINGVVA